jgi:LuxR family maltose regulon positive regulatory protein
MLNVPKAKITVPKAAMGKIVRWNLIDVVLNSPNKIAYIHAGAGFGKTTLLSQIANSAANAVWLSLDGENDLFTFVNTLCAAVEHVFPEFDFSVSEYLPFSQKDNFISMLASAWIYGAENIPYDFVLVLDDVHSIEAAEIRKFIACLFRYPPKNIRICLGSREIPWKDLLPLKLRGEITELTQKELAFSKEETADILGFDNPALYASTEGWPLAVSSFKVLLENGISIKDVPTYGSENLYSYLFHECICHLPDKLVDFLGKSASFDELDPKMLDHVLDQKNTRLILESLVSRNLFTVKTGADYYRYHALFRSSLLETIDRSQLHWFQQQAAWYYFDKQQYEQAACYALNTSDGILLEKIILASYRDYIKSGNYNQLRIWFQALDNADTKPSPEILVAKGAFLSVIGNFVQAKACLDTALPLLSGEKNALYFEATLHKARVLRNFVSFGESNSLLEELITKLNGQDLELAYGVIIEKLYNLCWDSQVNEAYSLARQMIENCAKTGNLKVRAWFERYLSVIHFFAGRMKESVYYYEKSLALPEEELNYLGMHSTAIYAAKAYQMLGERERSLSVLSEELQRLRNTGNYEEMWAGYLLAAEIHYQNTFIDTMNGLNTSFETAVKYFALADEYAPLYRKTDFQMQWAKLQQLTYSLIFTDDPKEEMVQEIFENLNQAGAYLKNLVLARLMGYFSAISDYPRAIKCAILCIEAGEEAGLMLHPSLAYGILARAAIAALDYEKAAHLCRHYLKLCMDNGLYEYFRLRKAYDPILKFAYDNGIEPEFTRQMMEFAGYSLKKAYIETLGAFTVYQNQDRSKSVKFRTKKERELLALLLDAGEQGATKEQIHNAIWWESDSKNIYNLIAVNLAHLKNDLEAAGISEALIYRENRYFICREKMDYDIDLFERTYREFKSENTEELASQLLSLYKGEYLFGFEALWATSKRLRYRKIFNHAQMYLDTLSRSGEGVVGEPDH